MKVILVVMTAIVLSLAPLANSEEISAKKKQLIDELLVLTGALKMAEIFSTLFVEQMTIVLQEGQPDIDPKAFVVLKEVINGVIHQEMFEDRVLNKFSYPIYDKYLTSEDIAELVRFYKTPVGQKTIRVLPVVTREAMQAGQEWGRLLGPKIQQRLMTRFKEEGIELK